MSSPPGDKRLSRGERTAPAAGLTGLTGEAEALLAAGRGAEALDAFRAAAERARPGSAEAAGLKLRTASALMSLARWDEAVATLAHRAGARVIVDNVFATAIDQHPLALGADLVVYSATKHIDGQGRCLGGAIL